MLIRKMSHIVLLPVLMSWNMSLHGHTQQSQSLNTNSQSEEFSESEDSVSSEISVSSSQSQSSSSENSAELTEKVVGSNLDAESLAGEWSLIVNHGEKKGQWMLFNLKRAERSFEYEGKSWPAYELVDFQNSDQDELKSDGLAFMKDEKNQVTHLIWLDKNQENGNWEAGNSNVIWHLEGENMLIGSEHVEEKTIYGYMARLQK